MNVYRIVFNMLMKMEKNAYSNIALSSAFNDSELSSQEKRTASRIFYGVIERKLTLDNIISKYSKKPVNSLDIEVLTVLRMGLYELKFMDSIPDNAAVNESVKLIKGAGKTSASGFVNAVLRNFIRDGKEITYPKDKVKRVSAECSCPEWLVKKLLDEYDEESILSLISLSDEPPVTSIRVNTLLTDAEKLMKILSDENIEAEKSDLIPECLYIKHSGAIENTNAYKSGLFHVQDISSQLCAMAVSAEPGDTVLDMCSAPGGKTFTIAEMMQNKGKVYAYELHEKRAALVAKGAERLGISIISANANDAAVYNGNIPLADKVLCDVPCAGFGVIRKKPEIKYKKYEDIKRLPEIQLSILETSSKYVRDDGTLVYSTCSVSREENDAVVDEFLRKNRDFEEVPFLKNIGNPFGSGRVTVFPKDFGSDGFFICKFIKKGMK